MKPRIAMFDSAGNETTDYTRATGWAYADGRKPKYGGKRVRIPHVTWTVPSLCEGLDAPREGK